MMREASTGHTKTPRLGPRIPATNWLRSYGRRRGRKPSSHQSALLDAVLPTVGLNLDAAPPDEATPLFPPGTSDLWLEIGFGSGEHLLWQAARNPQVGFIGCEPFQDGVIKVLSAVCESGHTNIRIYEGDVRPLLRWLQPASLGRVFAFFPDPWPKQRHRKRRLLNTELFGMLARPMRSGAPLCVATDCSDYADAILAAAREQGAFRYIPDADCEPPCWPVDRPLTRYEAKALAEGRRCHYLTFAIKNY